MMDSKIFLVIGMFVTVALMLFYLIHDYILSEFDQKIQNNTRMITNIIKKQNLTVVIENGNETEEQTGSISGFGPGPIIIK